MYNKKAMENKNKKVLVAMSGGVDSAVAAILLKDQGYDLVGATLRLYDNEELGENMRTCSSKNDVEDAKAVAKKLGFPHYSLEYKEEFIEKVINKFAKVYESGKTPNPCVDCNRYIKFEKMVEKAIEEGFDYIATGHYAQVEYDEKKDRYLLKKSSDPKKDQTYMLYNLTQEQLSKTIFPLDGLKKEKVRQIAEDRDMIVANKPDSQDICFVPDGDYEKFLRERMNINVGEGNFVDKEGNILGTHKGYINYTIGQRKGLGIALGKPAYVISINPEKNEVVLGDNEDLFSKSMTVKDLNMIYVNKLEDEMEIDIKTRYSQKTTKGKIKPLGNDRAFVEFDEPIRAVTPGQAAVFYVGDYVLGGGTIE